MVQEKVHLQFDIDEEWFKKRSREDFVNQEKDQITRRSVHGCSEGEVLDATGTRSTLKVRVFHLCLGKSFCVFPHVSTAQRWIRLPDGRLVATDDNGNLQYDGMPWKKTSGRPPLVRARTGGREAHADTVTELQRQRPKQRFDRRPKKRSIAWCERSL